MKRAFLDACVLFPPLVRGCLLHAAGQGLFAPLWSPGVVDEWAWANLRDHGPAGEAAAREEAAAMAVRWPDGFTSRPTVPDEGLTLPDADDVHVLLAAQAAGADYLITFNLRDFPARKLRASGLAPLHPDAFLWELAGASPEAMETALARALAPFPRLAADADEARRGLKRAQLPRLAKLLGTGALRLAEG